MPNTFKDIPLASDLLSVSQGDLKQNFDYVQGALGKDHQVVFGHSDTGTVFEGRHLQLSLKAAASNNPGFVGDGTDSEVFSFNGGLYFQSSAMNSGGILPYQLTDSNVVPSRIANKGFSFLPGGIMVCWGTQLATATNPIIFPNGGFTTAFIATGCTTANDRPFAVTAIGPTSFTYSVQNPTGVSIYWYAIGAK